MNFVSFRDLHNDIAKFSGRLPSDIDMIAGVPRSGLLVATLLGLHRNIAVCSLDDLLSGRHKDMLGLRRNFEHGYRSKKRNRILVIDDSLSSGATVEESKKRIREAKVTEPVSFAVLYMNPDREADNMVDHYHRLVPHKRIFEWNVFHSQSTLGRSCVDIDGVLCYDPPSSLDELTNEKGYADYVIRAPLKVAPSAKIACLVTSRLPKWRKVTERWLNRHGIRADKLVMSPCNTIQERRSKKIYAKPKAAVYKKQDFDLFIESSAKQAKQISDITGKPVLCVDEMRMYRKK